MKCCFVGEESFHSLNNLYVREHHLAVLKLLQKIPSILEILGFVIICS